MTTSHGHRKIEKWFSHHMVTEKLKNDFIYGLHTWHTYLPLRKING